MTRRVTQAALPTLAALLLLPGLTCPQQQSREVIVDNLDSGFTIIAGEWGAAASTDGNGSYGPNFRFRLADRVDVGIARFTPNIAQGGAYAVYIYWSADPNRTTDQPVIVHSATGDATHRVNLQQNGNQWFLLGTHTFNAGTAGYIQFTTDTDSGYCNADAVRLLSSP